MEKTDSCSEIFGKFQEKHQWQSSYHISSNNHPPALIKFWNFVQSWLIEGNTYLKAREMNHIEYQNLVIFSFKIRMGT